MFELAGLSTFLDIFQKAFGLIEKRKDQKRQLFNDIVEPVYTELTVVVGNYYEFFRSCRDDFSEAPPDSWLILVCEKRKKREEIVMARERVLGLTTPFLSAPDDKGSKVDQLLYRFAEAIKHFFYDSVDPPRGLSDVSSLLELIERLGINHDVGIKEFVIVRIEQHLANLERHWRAISAVYGELRVYCLS